MHNRKSHKDVSCAFMDGWKVQAVSCAVIFLEILRSAAKEQENAVTEPTADKLYWWRAWFCAEACFPDIWGGRKEVKDWHDWWVRLEPIHIRVFVLGGVVVKKYPGLSSWGEHESVKLPELFLGQHGELLKLISGSKGIYGELGVITVTRQNRDRYIYGDRIMYFSCVLIQDREVGGKNFHGGAESLLPFTQALWAIT